MKLVILDFLFLNLFESHKAITVNQNHCTCKLTQILRADSEKLSFLLRFVWSFVHDMLTSLWSGTVILSGWWFVNFIPHLWLNCSILEGFLSFFAILWRLSTCIYKYLMSRLKFDLLLFVISLVVTLVNPFSRERTIDVPFIFNASLSISVLSSCFLAYIFSLQPDLLCKTNACWLRAWVV